MNLSVATFLQTHLENEWLLYFFQLRILALRNFLWLTCSHVLRSGGVHNIQSLCLLHTEVEYSMAFSVVGGFSMGTRSCYIILREYTFSLTLDNTNPTAQFQTERTVCMIELHVHSVTVWMSWALSHNGISWYNCLFHRAPCLLLWLLSHATSQELVMTDISTASTLTGVLNGYYSGSWGSHRFRLDFEGVGARVCCFYINSLIGL